MPGKYKVSPMSQNSRYFLRRQRLDFTETVPSDVDKEYQQNSLRTHRRPHEDPIELREDDRVKDRARTEP